jgi:AMP deaminase
MFESEDREIYSQIIKAVRLRDKYVVGGPSMHPLKQEQRNPVSFSTLALNELIVKPMQDAIRSQGGDEDAAMGTASPDTSSLGDSSEEREFVGVPLACMESNPDGCLPLRFQSVNGVMEVYDIPADEETELVNLFPVPSVGEFYDDMDFMFEIRASGPVQSFCFNRLQLLQTKFELHGTVHTGTERDELKSNCHRDFYNVRKVDTHVHHSAAMNAKFLLRFIRKKARFFADDVVMRGNHGKEITLRELFAEMKVEPADLSLDKLNVMADKTTLHRFDRFNAKYSPMGEPSLRTVFLKTDNFMGGRYLAEMTKDLMRELEDSKYQHTEWRLSIYGRERNEWDRLSGWVMGNGLNSPNNRWMIQIPRLYNIYRKAGSIKSFQDMLDNIFTPLFEVTIDPTSHPASLSEFLNQVSGFDTVDDESKSPPPTDRRFSSRELTPEQWNLEDNPSYKYYSFYIYANIRVLNELRKMRNLRPFDYRPHAGEAGEIHHLDTAFLLADGINHGINLRKSPTLQYLFYITQIGLALSPCSNNQLFIPYEKNPFYTFFQRGLNVSLSTDDPLMFHQTKEPLMEEYSIAKQIYRLSQADTCEIARNSVFQSGYTDEEKHHWLGSLDRWKNDILKTNVPDIRIKFRHKTWLEEWLVLKGESQVMDSLVQFATQHLLSTPVVSMASMEPLTKRFAVEESEPEEPEKKKVGPSRVAPKKKYPLKESLPWYLSGAIVGAVATVVVLDIIRSKKM